MATSKEEALEIAKYMGCSGAHQHENGEWMPCADHETMLRISNEAEPEKKIVASNTSDEPRRKRKRRKGNSWEDLGEGGIAGIDTLPSGGLVSAVFTKSLPRIGSLSARFDPNAIDGDNDGLVQERTQFERPKTPNAPTNKPQQRISGSMSSLSPEDEQALRRYKTVLNWLDDDDFNNLDDYIEAIESGQTREELADKFPSIALLSKPDHDALIRGWYVDISQGIDSGDDGDDFSAPLIDAFTTDDLLDWDDYARARLLGDSQESLDRGWPQFAGLSDKEFFQLQSEIDFAEESYNDEVYLELLRAREASGSKPASGDKPLSQLEFDFAGWDYPAPKTTSTSKRQERGPKWLRRFKKQKPKKRYWNNTPYGGDKTLVEDQAKQVEKFREYAESGSWNKFHNEHYDWWTFPIDRGSVAYGEKYNIAKTNRKRLRNNKEFTDSVAEAARLYTSALGWDLDKEDWIENPDFDKGQDWRKFYGTRVYKMARSLQVLGRCKEFESVRLLVDSVKAAGKYVGNDKYWENPGSCPDDSTLPTEISKSAPRRIFGRMSPGNNRLASVERVSPELQNFHTNPDLIKDDIESTVNDFVIKKDLQGRVAAADSIITRINPKTSQPEILLIQRNNGPHKSATSGAWVIPGGFVDEGEDAQAAAIREMMEELNIDPDSIEILEQSPVGTITSNDWDIRFTSGTEISARHFVVASDIKFKASDDAAKAKWIPIRDISDGKVPIGFGHTAWIRAAAERTMADSDDYDDVDRRLGEIEKAGRARNQEVMRMSNTFRRQRNQSLTKDQILAPLFNERELGNSEETYEIAKPKTKKNRVTGSVSFFSGKRYPKGKLSDDQEEAIEKAWPVFRDPAKHVAQTEVTKADDGSLITTMPEVPGLADPFGPNRENIKLIPAPSESDGEEIISKVGEINKSLSNFTTNLKVRIEPEGNGFRAVIETSDGIPILSRFDTDRERLDRVLGSRTRLGRFLDWFLYYLPVTDVEAYERDTKGKASDYHPAALKNAYDFADTDAGRFAENAVDKMIDYANTLDSLSQFYDGTIRELRRRMGLPANAPYQVTPLADFGEYTYQDFWLQFFNNPSWMLLSDNNPFTFVHEIAHGFLGLGFDRTSEWRNGAAAAAIMGTDLGLLQSNYVYSRQGQMHNFPARDLSRPERDIQLWTPTSPDLYGWNRGVKP